MEATPGNVEDDNVLLMDSILDHDPHYSVDTFCESILSVSVGGVECGAVQTQQVVNNLLLTHMFLHKWLDAPLVTQLKDDATQTRGWMLLRQLAEPESEGLATLRRLNQTPPPRSHA